MMTRFTPVPVIGVGARERTGVVEGGEVARAERRPAVDRVLRPGMRGHVAERGMVQVEVVEAVQAEDDGGEISAGTIGADENVEGRWPATW